MKNLINLKEIRNKIITKNNLYCFCIISIIFFLDRYTKLLILNNFTEDTYYLNDYLNFDLVWNTGVGFGLFATNSSVIYNLITFLIGFIILALIYMTISFKNLDKFIFSIIIGGALGNFYDRLNLNAVPDFIDLHYNEFHWFTFNIADIFITLGIIIFITRGTFEKN